MIKYLVLFSLIVASIEIEHCLTNKTICNACISGFTLVKLNPDETTCIENSKYEEIIQVAHCVEREEDEGGEKKCKKCERDFLINNDHKTCLDKKHCSSLSSENTCIDCFPPFLLDGEECKEKVLCKELVDSICISCEDKYYPDSKGDCKRLPTGCSSYNNTKNECSDCIEKYYLEDGKCKPWPTGCSEFNETKKECTKCADRNYLDNKECKPWPTGCTKFNETIKECTKCTDRTYLDNKECKPWPTGCTEFNETIKECTKCSTEYYLVGKECKLPCSGTEVICTECDFNHKSYDYGKTCKVLDPDLDPTDAPPAPDNNNNSSSFMNFNLAIAALILSLIL